MQQPAQPLCTRQGAVWEDELQVLQHVVAIKTNQLVKFAALIPNVCKVRMHALSTNLPPAHSCLMAESLCKVVESDRLPICTSLRSAAAGPHP